MLSSCKARDGRAAFARYLRRAQREERLPTLRATLLSQLVSIVSCKHRRQPEEWPELFTDTPTLSRHGASHDPSGERGPLSGYAKVSLRGDDESVRGDDGWANWASAWKCPQCPKRSRRSGSSTWRNVSGDWQTGDCTHPHPHLRRSRLVAGVYGDGGWRDIPVMAGRDLVSDSERLTQGTSELDDAAL